MKFLVISRVDVKEGRISPKDVDPIIKKLHGLLPSGTKYTYHEGFSFDPGDRHIWLELGQGAVGYLSVVEDALGADYAVEVS